MAQLENFRLKVFRAVAAHLNFRVAAEHLFLTQPAVTLQIKALENDLGVRLFNRVAGRVSLTTQGKLLLRYARELAALAAAAEQELGATDGNLSGTLSLGVSTTIAQYVLPRLIGAFLAENPRVQLSLHSGNTENIVDHLLADKVSIGLIEGPARNRGVRAKSFMQDELVLIAPPDFHTEQMTPQQLVAATLLMRERGSGTRSIIEAALVSADCPLKSFKHVMDLDSTEAIKSAVESGLGVGYVSRWAIAKELELGTLKMIKVRGINITRDFSLVYRTGPTLNGIAEAFRLYAIARGPMLSRIKYPAR